MAKKKKLKQNKSTKKDNSLKNKTKDELIEEINKLNSKIKKSELAVDGSKNEEYYKMLYESIPLGFQSLDEDGRLIDVNQAWLNILGYTREEVIGRWFGDFLAPEFIDAFQENFFVLKSEGKIHSELYMIHKNGSRRHIKFESKIIYNPNGSFKQTCCILLDVTESKQMEKIQQIYHDLVIELNTCVNLLQGLNVVLKTVLQLESIDCGGIYIADQTENSLSLAVHHGLSNKFIDSTSYYTADSPQMRLALKGDAFYGSYADIRPKNDDIRKKEGLLAFAMIPIIYQGQLIAVFNLASHSHDNIPIDTRRSLETIAIQLGSILMRLQTEDALRESEKQYKELIDGMIETVWIINFDGNLLDVNKTAVDVLGYSKEELLSVGIFGIDYLSNKKEIRSLAESMPIDKVQKFESMHKAKDGRVFPVEISSSLVTYHGEKAILSIARDITDRKKAEEALIENELKYQMIFKSMSQGFYLSQILYDENGIPCDYKFIDANSAFEEIIGLKLEQIIGKTYNELVPPDPKSGWLDCFKRVAMTGIPENYTFLSTIYNCYFEVYAFIPDEGKFCALVKNITERKKIENALRENTALLEAQLNSSIEGILVVDSNGKKILQNKRTVELWKIPQDIADNPDDSMQVQHVMQMTKYPEDFIEKIKYLYNHPDEISRDEVELINGTILDRYSAQVIGNDGKYYGRIWAFRDITNHKKAEEKLEASKKQLSNALEIADLGHWEYDVESDLFTFNDQFYKIFHTTVDEVGGYKMHAAEYASRFVHPEDMSLVEEETRKALETTDPNYSQQVEHRIIFPDGTIGYISVRIFIAKDSQGKTVKTFGVNQNITEGKKAEEKIRKLNEELEIKVKERTAELEIINKELESFSYSISHDLRAPLRHINSFTAILSDEIKSNLNDTSEKYIKNIINATRKMNALIDDLLAFSKMTRNNIDYKNVNMNNLVKEIINSLSDEISERNINWVIKKLPKINCDLSMIRQVLINLIQNSIKFTSKVKKAIIEIGYSENENENIFYIKDNGVGFDEKYKNKLFGVFQRLHSEKEFLGTGIGLALVKKIIVRHGGSVWAESKINKGATFYFILPK